MIEGMRLVADRPKNKHGNAVFVRPDIVVKSTAVTEENGIEIISVELEKCTVTSIYKPPKIPFVFRNPRNI